MEESLRRILRKLSEYRSIKIVQIGVVKFMIFDPYDIYICSVQLTGAELEALKKALKQMGVRVKISYF
ncbi:MAG: hypothetical protein Q6363_004245 [Candidatus Njordarchaeota archaeon]